MKKIISFMLALVMIASMAVVAFAEGEAATPAVKTIYDAADFATREDVIITPDNLRGYTGFGEMTLKIDEELAAVAAGQTQTSETIALFNSDDLKSGNTVFVYYYVAANNGVQVLAQLQKGENTYDFQIMDPTSGYHMSEIHLTADWDSLSIHIKHTDAAAAHDIEMYVGGVEVMDGTVYAPLYMDAETLVAAGASYGEGKGAILDNGMYDNYQPNAGWMRMFNLEKIGYNVTGDFIIYIEYDSDFHSTANYRSAVNGGFNLIDYGFSNTDGRFGTGIIAGLVQLDYTGSELYMDFHYSSLSHGTNYFHIKSVTLMPKPAAGESLYMTPETVYGCFNQGAAMDAWTINCTGMDGFIHRSAFSAGDVKNFIEGEKIFLDYEVTKAGNGGLFLYGGASNFVPVSNSVGHHAVESTVPFTSHYINLHDNGGEHTQLFVNSVTLGEAREVVDAWAPIDLLGAEKYAAFGSAEIACELAAEKYYTFTVNYKAFIGDEAPTVTVGNKTITLKAGVNTTTFTTAGADKIVFNAPGSVVLVGDITAQETNGLVYAGGTFNENVVPTPAAAAGKKGFSDFAFKVDKDLAASTDAVCEMWTMSNLKAGNTLKFYYYVAENTGAQVMIYGLDGASFYTIDGSVGYHLAEIAITKDIAKIAVYVKNATAEAKSVELYVGSAVVREGLVFEPRLPVKYDAATLYETGATPGTLVDGGVEVVLSGDYNRFLDADVLGYAAGVYNLVIEYDYDGPDTPLYFHNGACEFQGAMDLLTTGSGTITATVAAGDHGVVYYNFHAPNKGGKMTIKSISIIDSNVANNIEAYFDAATLSATGATPGTLANGAVEVVLSGDYNRFLDADVLGYAAGVYNLVIEYDYDGPDTPLYFHNGACEFQGAMDLLSTGSGTITATVAAGDHGVVYYNFHAPNKGGTMKIKSIIIYDSALGNLTIAPVAHPVLEEKYPLELAAEKFANKGTADISAALDAEKAYYVTVNYTNYSTDASATVTVGNKTLNLAPGANKELTFAIAAGANKVVFNSPNSAVLIGDITAIEATADEKAVIGALNAIPGTKTLDKTLATTTATIEAYVKSVIEEKYEGCTDVVVTCAEDTFVAFTANKNGSANVTVSLKKDGVELTDTISFNIVSGALSEYDAVVATGDSAIVAIVALIAVISLAGVVIAKKKVASK